MKKISLRNLELSAVEKLSSAELKEILGGNTVLTTGSGSTCNNKGDSCTTADGKAGTCSYHDSLLRCTAHTNYQLRNNNV